MQHAEQHHGHEEGRELHHHLIIVVFHAALANEFRVQRHGLLVIYGHLKQQEILESGGEDGIRQEHQNRPFPREYRGQHQHERQQENGRAEDVFRVEQLQDVFAAHHQAVDVVAFVAHNARELHRAENHKVVDAPEICHQLAVIDVGEGDDDAEHENECRRHDESLARVFVAQNRLDFQFQVLPHLAEAVEIGKLADAAQVGLLGSREFAHHVGHLQSPVDGHKHGEQHKRAEVGQGASLADGRSDACIELEKVLETLRAKAFQQNRQGDEGIDRDGHEPIEKAVVDERAHDGIPLAIGQNQQVEAEKEAQRCPKSLDEEHRHHGVGHEHRKPDEIAAVEERGADERVDADGFRDGQQHVGFHDLRGRLLCGEAKQEVEQQNERRDAHHQLQGRRRGAFVGNQREHHGEKHQIDNHKTAQKPHDVLRRPVLFKVEGAFFGQFAVSAQLANGLQSVHRSIFSVGWGVKRPCYRRSMTSAEGNSLALNTKMASGWFWA